MGKRNAGLAHECDLKSGIAFFESQHRRIIKLSEMPSCQSTSLKGLFSPPSVLRGNNDTRGEAHCSERPPIHLLRIHLGGHDPGLRKLVANLLMVEGAVLA